jgi:hypothetical protein
MSSILDPRYKSSVNGRAVEGDISWDMFHGRQKKQLLIPITNFDKYIRSCLRDRRDINPSNIEAYTPPLSKNTRLNAHLTHHMYGTLQTNDPYTEDTPDTQIYEHDPRGFNLTNFPWKDSVSMSQNKMKTFDFGPSGAYTGDSGTTPQGDFQQKLADSRRRLQANMKNFQESQVTIDPRGLYRHDPNKVATVRYNSISNPSYPIQRFDSTRQFVPQLDNNFRSLTESTQIPGTSKFGFQLQNSGLIPINNVINSIRDDQVNKQLTEKTKFIPKQTVQMAHMLANSLAIDSMLKEQKVEYNRQTAWFLPKSMAQYQINSTSTSPQKTLLPGVMGVQKTDQEMAKNNIEYEYPLRSSYSITSINTSRKGAPGGANSSNIYTEDPILSSTNIINKNKLKKPVRYVKKLNTISDAVVLGEPKYNPLISYKSLNNLSSTLNTTKTEKLLPSSQQKLAAGKPMYKLENIPKMQSYTTNINYNQGTNDSKVIVTRNLSKQLKKKNTTNSHNFNITEPISLPQYLNH